MPRLTCHVLTGAFLCSIARTASAVGALFPVVQEQQDGDVGDTPMSNQSFNSAAIALLAFDVKVLAVVQLSAEYNVQCRQSTLLEEEETCSS